MTTDPTPTIAQAFTWHPHAFASRNDGTGGGDLLALTVHVEFAAVDLQGYDGTEAAAAEIGAWLDTYVAGKDLTHQFDFAPIPRYLAQWIARVCEQHAGQAFAAVTVSDGYAAVRVQYRQVQPS